MSKVNKHFHNIPPPEVLEVSGQESGQNQIYRGVPQVSGAPVQSDQASVYDNSKSDAVESVNSVKSVKSAGTKNKKGLPADTVSGILRSEKHVWSSFMTQNDPLLEVTGSAEESNPEELEELIGRLEKDGFEVVRTTRERLA